METCRTKGPPPQQFVCVNALAEALGLAGGIAGLSVAAPQVWKAYKRGGSGVSVGTWMLMYTAYCSWLGYGLRTNSPSQVAANVVAGVLGAWLLYVLLAGTRWRWVIILGAPVTSLALIMSLSEPAMNAVLLSFEAAFIPQIVKSYKAWRGKVPAPGVSLLAWTLSAVSSLLWLSYAIVGGRLLVVATCLIALVCASAILLFSMLANSSGASREPASSDTAHRS